MRRALLILVPLGLVAIGVAGWWWFTRENLSPPPPWTDNMQAVADGNNQFAFDLYAKLRDTEKGNLFFSPYSAHTALAMTATGARGTTRDEMVKVLHLPADEQKALASGDLGKFYGHPRRDFQLSVANALWGQKAYPWRPEFLELQNTQFRAAFQEADFISNPDGERKRINQWAEGQTRGKIKDLLPERIITAHTRMVLANAIYFKGAWQDKFDKDKTRPMPFTLADGSEVEVPMMTRREGGFRHYVEPGPKGRWEPEFEVAELPYRGGELSMVVLLPGKHNGIPSLETKLSAASLADWLAKAHDATASDMLFLPRFRIETPEMPFKEPLQKLGMLAAFDPTTADFAGLSTSAETLHIGLIVQKAFVEVNEEGTEGAAATAVTTKKGGDDFRADRPFLFLIRDVKHGTILFMGRVMNPKG
jgi:serpin B